MLFSPSFACLLASFLSIVPNTYALPTEHGTLYRRNATDQTVYYGINIADHEKRVTSLKANGYRPISLNIYGPSDSAKFAAIWTKETGPSFEIISGVDGPTYNAWQAQWKSNGYVSTHVSAAGDASSALYAGIMAKIPTVSNWVQACDLQNPWDYENVTSGLRMSIKGISMYGAPSSRRYCVLGHENLYNQQQTVFYSTDYYQYNYENLYTAETQKRFWRPTFLHISSDHLITPIFDDTNVGNWTALTDLTSTQLATEITKQEAAGLQLVQLSGAEITSSNTTLYTAIFTEHITPYPRTWHAVGSVTGFQNNTAVTTALDSTLQTFMTLNGIRQAQVAASVNGTIVASRAYTLAEPDRATVSPNDKFLLASLSKMFTHAATQHLIDTGKLNLTTQIYPLLGFVPADERAVNITVQHLIEHSAGYDRSVSGDLGFLFTTIARAKNQSTPATLRDVIYYVVARPLDFTPGTQGAYSNYGTMLLSYVLTNLTEIAYMDYLREFVLEGLEVELYATRGAEHVSDRVVQETKYTGLNALEPAVEKNVPGVHGGDGAVKEEAVASFGLRASAETVVRFIGGHAVSGIGERAVWGSRDGSLMGARAFAESRPELDWAIILNSREYVSERMWENLVYFDVPDVWGKYALA
ncbi:beta-lactamase/transpeptidase-like protein [Dendryphion nanum]|uniref:Beta-lactamase/transpeptidase-like protein n=1 Tax=Dendryphion nanum TaxID=256645 RepID=A0A9P9ILZ8_9PLEO|nr:beta-lactamase/transpeptidase-like protein [Dendryphion nanum]